MSEVSERACGESMMRSAVKGWVAEKPEFARTMGGGAVCRLQVIGESGPASNPPTVSLYITNGGDEEEEGGLRVDEARRCALGLRKGDLIWAVGDIGPARAEARRQEVLVTERVVLRARAA